MRTYWYPNHRGNQVNSLKSWAQPNAVGIIKINNIAYRLASIVNGKYNCMEEIECKRLIEFCKDFEGKSKKEQILSLFKIAFDSMTKVGF